MEVQQKQSSWVFITPIFNLELTDAVGGEFKVDRVTFIDSGKLQRIRGRMGIQKTHLIGISAKLKKSGFDGLESFFSKYKTFAILRQSGKPEEIKTQCFRTVQEELLILASSQLYFKNRRYTGFVGLAGEHDRAASTHLFIDSQNPSLILGNQLLRSPDGLKLDDEWVQYHKQFFFFQLIKILTRKIQVAPKWRNDLQRAVFLIGKSINTNYVEDAFLWNMIALELLLTNQGDSYSTELPKRIQSLIGWDSLWDQEDYADKIGKVYKLRCQYVHDGDSSKISKNDLLFTDNLVFNVLWNLVAFSNRFGSKDEIIKFSDKAEARRLLNIKQPQTPKLKSANKQYTQADMEDV